MNQILVEAKNLEAEIIEMRRYAHQIPELGFKLPQTTAFIKQKLTEYGYSYEEPCEGAVIAYIGDGKGKTLLLRADIDALPIQEETDLPFCSTNGCAHACGHDAHLAMLLGAAKLLKIHEAEIHGTVKLVFQPDEEGCAPIDDCGSHVMVQHGVLEGVDAALGMHIWSGLYSSDKIVYRYGTCMSSCDDVILTIHGKGTHGGIPHKGVDPIAIAFAVYQGMLELIARESNPAEQTVLTFGKIAGGDTANILPSEVTLVGTLRTANEATRTHLKERIITCATKIAEAYLGSCEVRFHNGIPSVYNDPDFTKEIVGSIEAMMGVPCFQDPEINGVSDDFSIFSHQIPSCYLGLGAGDALEGYCLAHHHPKVMFNEAVMYKGCAIYTQAALQFLK